MTSDRDDHNLNGVQESDAAKPASTPRRSRERLSLEEIARLSGVSRSTVSRVINDDARVSDAVRARVQRIIAEQNYFPNAAARSLASRRTGIIGLLIPRAIESVFGDRFFQMIIKSIATTANRTEQQLMLLLESSENGENGESAQRLFNRVIGGRHLDGIVVVSSEVDEPLVELLDRYHFPSVLVGRHPTLEMSFVDVDNQHAARLAVEHLLSHGHRRIGMIGGPDNLIAAIDRRAGYMQALSAARLPVDPQLYRAAGFDQQQAKQAAHELLAIEEPPTAIFAASDAMAIGALEAAQERGLRVPDDLALFGFDGNEIAAAANPPISTVLQPIPGLGQESVVMLMQRIDAPDAPPMHRFLPTELLLRASCGCTNAAPANQEDVGG
ncbi:MAG: LacI family DNA-binding transcriptional regulator [Thermomicrobiales bacterium]